MSIFRNMTIRAKIYVSFVIVLFLAAIVGALAVNRLAAVNSDAAEIRDNWLPSVGVIGALLNETNKYRIYESAAISARDPKDSAAEEVSATDSLKEIERIRREYERLLTPGYETDTYRRFGEIWSGYLKISQNKLFPAARANDDSAVAIFRGDSRTEFFKIRELLKNLVDFNTDGGRDAADRGAATYRAASRTILVVLIVALVFGLGAAYLINVTVSNPVRRTTGLMRRLADHDLAADIEGTDRRDEIGAMARAVVVFRDGLIAADRLKAEQEATRAAERVRSERVDALLTAFESAAAATLRSIAAAATELDATAKSMSTTAERTNDQSQSVASAAEQTSVNVQTVASAAEQMASSIHEIAGRVADSSGIARGAVEEVNRTNETVRGLTEAAKKIGDVVGLITGIAGQTNLLALNATIEAARAGEAGKGFAVVASEVKQLANQTASATEDISAQVAAIQAVTTEAVRAISGIGGIISRVDEITSAVAAAVEEQGAATSEISRNAQEAAKGTQEVTRGTIEVTRAAGETGAASRQVMSAAEELAEQAEGFRREVERFLAEIKSV